MHRLMPVRSQFLCRRVLGCIALGRRVALCCAVVLWPSHAVPCHHTVLLGSACLFCNEKHRLLLFPCISAFNVHTTVFFSLQSLCLMHTGKPMEAWRSATASPGFRLS